MDRKAAILFSNFGPYHAARIEALREALVHHGVALCAFRFTERSDDYGWKPEEPKGVPVVTLSQRKPAGFVEAVKMAASFGHELRKRKVDAVFLPTYSPLPNLLCFLAAKLAGCRTILMTESWHGTEGASLPGRLIKHALVRMFDSALVGGTAQRDYVVAYGMPRDKVFKGYDVVDVAHFSARADIFRATRKGDEWRVTSEERGSAFARRDSDVTSSGQQEVGDRISESGEPAALIRSLPERYFLNLGRFVEKKNLSALVEAYARFVRASGERSKAETGNLKPEVPETADGGDAAATRDRGGIAGLVLVGEGPMRGDLERQARELGLVVRDGVRDPNPSAGAEVVFYPFQQADLTPLFFARCEAFVLPSSREEWGLVVNEAMACGAPVVVSSCVGARFDLVEEGKNGFMFGPDNVQRLAEIFDRFAADASLSRRMGDEGRRMIQPWTPERFGEAGLSALKAARGA